MANSRVPVVQVKGHPRGTALPLARLLDIEEVADHLGVGVRHVRRLVAERRIPFVKWGHLLRFDPNELAAWIDDSRVSRLL